MSPALRLVLCLALIPGAILGCGKLPSRLKDAGQKPLVPVLEKGAEADSGDTFEARGYRWRIREARPRMKESLQSAFELGSPVSVHALVSGDRAELAAPVRWPAEAPSRLVMEVSPAPEASALWSYRCLFPDGRVAEDSQQQGEVRPVVMDPEAGVGLILLEEAFGERGERQDPATQCHIEVRLPGEKPFVISIRALGEIPGLEQEVEEIEPKLGEVFRTETWTNPTLRRVALRLDPQADIESRQLVREVRYPESSASSPPEARVRVKRIRGKGFEVEASVDGGAWKLAANARVIFGPKESHVIRFRLRLGRGMLSALIPAPRTRRFDWVEERHSPRSEFDRMIRRSAEVMETTSLLETRFLGLVDWKAQLEEAGGWGESRAISAGKSVMEPFASDALADESFDWEGWVS